MSSFLLPALMAGGSILSGVMQSRAGSRAVDAQTDAAQAGIAEQQRQFDRTQQNMAPWLGAGRNALAQLQSYQAGAPGRMAAADGREKFALGALAGQLQEGQGQFQNATRDANAGLNRRLAGARGAFNNDTRNAIQRSRNAANSLFSQYNSELRNARQGMYDRYDEIQGREFEADPGYQFRLEQGERALNRNAAARGSVLGGATMQRLGEFNSGLASQEYGNFDARRRSDAGMEMNRAVQQFTADRGIADSRYNSRMNQANADFTRSYGRAGDVANMARGDAGQMYSADYGRAGDVLQTDAGRAGAIFDARMNTSGNQYARGVDQYNALAQLADTGMTAAGNVNAAGSNMASNIGTLYGNIGDAQAGGAVNSFNALSGTMDNLFSIGGAGSMGMFGSGFQNWLTGGGPNPAAIGSGMTNSLMRTLPTIGAMY